MRTRKVITRLHDGGEKHETMLTIDDSNLTQEQKDEYLDSAVTIQWQSAIRRKGETPPATATIVVKPKGTKTPGAMSARTLLVKMFGEEEADSLIEEFGGAEEAKDAILQTMKESRK